ncbi:MAG: hypothetical protein IPG87_08645 [Saprospiraceae bacterium]|nr:hypothetical protein [Candidatus Vicinibacter affinis]
MICNRVLDFDGINDQVLCNTPNIRSTAFTIEFWFKSENNRQGNCDTNSLTAFNWIFSFAGDKFGLGDCKGNLKLIYSPIVQLETLTVKLFHHFLSMILNGIILHLERIVPVALICGLMANIFSI